MSESISVPPAAPAVSAAGAWSRAGGMRVGGMWSGSGQKNHTGECRGKESETDGL